MTEAQMNGAAILDKSFDNNKFEITPSDTEFLKVPVDLIYAAGAGDIMVGTGTTEPVALPVDAGGSVFVGQINRVYATGTTATGLVGVASKALR